MAERPNPPMTEDCDSPLARTLGHGCETVLPQNDTAVVSDNEFLENRKKLVDRSKLIFWWRSVSRVFNMVAGILIPAGIMMVVTGLTAATGFTGAQIAGTSVIFGVAAVGLGVGIATDYFENILAQNQGFDTQDLSGKRYATHLARALDEVGKEEKLSHQKKSRLADKLRPQANISWEEKTRVNPQAVSQSIN